MVGTARLCSPSMPNTGGSCWNQSYSNYITFSSISIPNLSFSSSSSSSTSTSTSYPSCCCSSLSSSRNYHCYRFSFLLSTLKAASFSCKPKRSSSLLISCRHPRPSFDPKSYNDNDRDYVEASILFPETAQHYRLFKQGFQEALKWKVSAASLPFSSETKHYSTDAGTLGLDFLWRFQTPTIFLKISCGGDFLLPIVVGEYAVEKLLSSSVEDNSGDCPNHYQFVRNLVDRLGYEVKMVKITERVANTYYSRMHINKVGKKDYFSVDTRPSDAINVARRYKAPIYVNKQIVMSDAIRIGYVMGRPRDAKTIYDVSLDSAAEGEDLLTEELDLVRSMNLAVQEERYIDAAMMKDKLDKLRKSGREH